MSNIKIVDLKDKQIKIFMRQKKTTDRLVDVLEGLDQQNYGLVKTLLVTWFREEIAKNELRK